MTQTLLMLQWLPASWKSSFAQSLLEKDKKFARVNNDELRQSINNWVYSKTNEEMIAFIVNWIITSYLAKWYSVVVDNTNLNPIHKKELNDIAKTYNAEFQIKEFPVDVDTCVERDKLRSSPVGEKVIRDMAKKWNYYPTPPREFAVIDQDGTLPTAYIFDIDGTLAFMNWRSPYDYTKVGEDECHLDVKRTLLKLAHWGDKIIIVSWRKDDCHFETTKWLEENGIKYDELHMRKSNDTRKDSHVKYDILKELTQKYYIEGIYDDRDQVVKMSREAGFRVYQVNYGNF